MLLLIVNKPVNHCGRLPITLWGPFKGIEAQALVHGTSEFRLCHISSLLFRQHISWAQIRAQNCLYIRNPFYIYLSYIQCPQTSDEFFPLIFYEGLTFVTSET